jgi:hypothetical protein
LPFFLYPQKPLHGVSQLPYLILSLIAIPDGLPYAVLDVVLKQDERDLL